MGKKAIYFHTLNGIESIVRRSGESLEVRFRKKNENGRMVSAFEASDMITLNLLVADIRQTFSNPDGKVTRMILMEDEIDEFGNN